MILRVTQYGEPVLRKKGVPVTSFDSELKTLAANMIETMREYDGIGLAAQQVNLPIRLFVVDLSDYPELGEIPFSMDGKILPLELLMPMAFVNPVLEFLPGPDVIHEEGCLSFPGLRGNVKRPERIRVRYSDPDGAEHVIECGGWLARVIEHEYDHLEGVLFIDRMEPDSLREIEGEVKRLKKETMNRRRTARAGP